MSLLATVGLPSVTGLPADTVTNSFAVKAPAGPTNAELTSLMTALIGFYNTAGPTIGEALCYRMSKNLSRGTNQSTIKVYDITGREDGTPHGSPIASALWTLGAAGAAAGLPSEVAVVLRLEAAGRAGAPVELPDGADPGLAVDRPKQRYTGRVYIGPLTGDAVDIVTNVPRVGASLTSALLDSGERLKDAINAIGAGWDLAVWSRSDAILRAVDNVAVDNAFDTQRRRGEKPTGITRRAV